MNTVATITGFKAHYAKPGHNTTLCGREVSNTTTGDDMCKRCVATRAKLDAYNDRTAYNADVAEAQDDVMNEAVPAERTGVDLTAEQHADKTIREHKLSDTMVETLTYRYSSMPEAVHAQMWCDARTEAALVKRGLMHPTKSHRTPLGHKVAQILMAPYAKPATEIPGQIDGLDVIAETETEVPAATCHDCRKPVGTDHAWNCHYARNGLPSPQPVADPAPKIPAQRPKPDTQTDRAAERDTYARTVAVQYSRQHRQIGMLCNDGSIPQPDSLIREIRSAMADIVMLPTGNFVQVTEDVTRLAELGWLLAYVMESGTVDSDGWQDRRRPAVPGWEDQETYDLDTDSADALPAWADWQGNDEGCRGVIDPGSREQPAEHCGTPVTREEYYAAGDEGVRCEVHRTSFERAGEQPW
jgi:hypothetical protein